MARNLLAKRAASYPTFQSPLGTLRGTRKTLCFDVEVDVVDGDAKTQD